MMIYVLICEAHGDDDRLLGVYESVRDAVEAHGAWEDCGLYPFYRIEERVLGGDAFEWSPAAIVYESHPAED